VIPATTPGGSASRDTAPQEEIAIAGAVLVRARAVHAEPLVAVLVGSLGHLSRWMPWATPENATLTVQSARLEQVERQWADGTDFDYLIVTSDGAHAAPGTIAGGMSLMTRRGPGVLEIGYWLSVDHVGRGLATGAARALTAAGLSMPGIERIEIHCDARNQASAAIPQRLGYALDRIDDREPATPGESGREMVWTMQSSHWTPGRGA
jgi:RimJ/RimL family protein N-acetyltransferase